MDELAKYVDHRPNAMDKLEMDVGIEHFAIFFTYAIPHPKTVMIEGRHTLPTQFAMFTSKWLLD
jgi:hypothetical protein